MKYHVHMVNTDVIIFEGPTITYKVEGALIIFYNYDSGYHLSAIPVSSILRIDFEYNEVSE